MTTQTPTQIATEKIQLFNLFRTKIEEEKRLDEENADTIVSFYSLKCEILAYKTAWENELEFLETILFCPEHYCKTLINTHESKKRRREELTNALKILDGGK